MCSPVGEISEYSTEPTPAQDTRRIPSSSEFEGRNLALKMLDWWVVSKEWNS